VRKSLIAVKSVIPISMYKPYAGKMLTAGEGKNA
jgi:hypothetical protein